MQVIACELSGCKLKQIGVLKTKTGNSQTTNSFSATDGAENALDETQLLLNGKNQEG